MTDTPNADPDDFDDPLSDFEPAEHPSELHRVLAEEPISTMQATPSAQVTADTSIGEAATILCGLKVSSLLVVDSGKVVGIFTERDILEKAAERYPEMADRPVSEIMSADPLVVYETDPVGASLAAIAVAGHRHVPVLKIDGTVAGIVSPKRVLRRLHPHLS